MCSWHAIENRIKIMHYFQQKCFGALASIHDSVALTNNNRNIGTLGHVDFSNSFFFSNSYYRYLQWPQSYSWVLIIMGNFQCRRWEAVLSFLHRSNWSIVDRSSELLFLDFKFIFFNFSIFSLIEMTKQVFCWLKRERIDFNMIQAMYC